jgi:hypothetical protein
MTYSDPLVDLFQFVVLCLFGLCFVAFAIKGQIRLYRRQDYGEVWTFSTPQKLRSVYVLTRNIRIILASFGSALFLWAAVGAWRTYQMLRPYR